MDSVDVRRVPEGYAVSRVFASQAAAQRGADLLISVNEAAFVPVGGPAAYDAHPFLDGQGSGFVQGGSPVGGWLDPVLLKNPVRQDTGD